MNKKIASACIIVVMATVIFGTFYVNRVASQPGLKINLWISCGLNPLPQYAANDIVYVVISAQGYGGAPPYSIQLYLRQGEDPPQLWYSYEQTSMYGGGMPVVWSTHTPTLEAQRTLDIFVRITDSQLAIAEQGSRIYLPTT